MKRAWWLLLTPALLGAGAPEYRFHRAIEAEPGFCELELPNEVLERARPLMSDVRVMSDRGEEIPYALDVALPIAAHEYTLLNVEVIPGTETTGIIDRGGRAGLASAAERRRTTAHSLDCNNGACDFGRAFMRCGRRKSVVHRLRNHRRDLRLQLPVKKNSADWSDQHGRLSRTQLAPRRSGCGRI